ncbi:MAG: PilN domain-containing protein [Rhodanobacter sp.]
MSSATQSLRPLLDRLRRGWRASPLPAFLGWWGGELHSMLPPRWRSWFSSGADWYLLQRTGLQWTLHRAGYPGTLAAWDENADVSGLDAGVRTAPWSAALRHVDREDLRLALLMPTEAALRRTLALPLAARDNLAQVMAFELDRQTPFTLAQVYYAVRDLPTPAAEGRFNAELVTVTRGTLDPLLTQLRAQGIPIDAVDLALGHHRLGINLLPAEQTPRHLRPRRRLNLILAACGVVLLGLVLNQWLHNRQTAVAQMQAEVDGMRGEAQQVASLRQQLQDNAGAAGFLAQRKKNTVSVLGLLQDVTARLPDTTYLERFGVDNTGQISMQGQSQQAAKLLDALKDSSLITQASFQGSIQAAPATGKEIFYLIAQLHQPVTARPKSAVSDSEGGAR